MILCFECSSALRLIFVSASQNIFYLGLYVMFFVLNSILSIIFVLLLQLPPGRNSDPESHSGHFPPRDYACLRFYREKSSAFSSLVDSRRNVHTRAARRYRYLLIFFCARKIPLAGFELTQSISCFLCHPIPGFRYLLFDLKKGSVFLCGPIVQHPTA